MAKFYVEVEETGGARKVRYGLTSRLTHRAIQAARAFTAMVFTGSNGGGVTVYRQQDVAQPAERIGAWRLEPGTSRFIWVN